LQHLIQPGAGGLAAGTFVLVELEFIPASAGAILHNFNALTGRGLAGSGASNVDTNVHGNYCFVNARVWPEKSEFCCGFCLSYWGMFCERPVVDEVGDPQRGGGATSTPPPPSLVLRRRFFSLNT
jgi:hypothetical protein